MQSMTAKVCPKCGWEGQTEAAVCPTDFTLLMPNRPKQTTNGEPILASNQAERKPLFGSNYTDVLELSRDDKWIVYSAVQKLLKQKILLKALISTERLDIKNFMAEMKVLSADSKPSPDGTICDVGVTDNGFVYATFLPPE